jgi:hypothetical protein
LNTTNLSNVTTNPHRRSSQSNINNESFQLKLSKLLELWRRMSYNDEDDDDIENGITNTTTTTNMADMFEHLVLGQERAQNAKLVSIYGLGEDTLPLVYIEKSLDHRRRRRQQQSSNSNNEGLVGGFAFERSELCSHFLDMFFKLAFDQTEDWSHLIQGVNGSWPLLSEFYDEIREQELSKIGGGGGDGHNYIDKMYLITQPQSMQTTKDNDHDSSILPLLTRKQRRRQQEKEQMFALKNKNFIDDDEDDVFRVSVEQRRGLFRTYSVRSLSSHQYYLNQNYHDHARNSQQPHRQFFNQEGLKLRKAVSFSDVSWSPRKKSTTMTSPTTIAGVNNNHNNNKTYTFFLSKFLLFHSKF